MTTEADVEAVKPSWPPLDENGRIPAECLEAEWRAYAHRVMAMLHAEMAASGATYETIAARVGWPLARVKRAMWDPNFYRGQKPVTDMACAMGRRVLVGAVAPVREAALRARAAPGEAEG